MFNMAVCDKATRQGRPVFVELKKKKSCIAIQILIFQNKSDKDVSHTSLFRKEGKIDASVFPIDCDASKRWES